MKTIQRGHPPIGYLTASEAKKRLGNISDGKFRSFINAGKIERYIPPGMSQGFYKRDNIEQLAKEIESPWYGGVRITQTHFRQATPKDISAIADIDERIFNAPEEEPVPRKTYLHWDEETYLRWMQRNPQTFFVLSNTANTVVGFASLLPLKKDTLDQLIRDEIRWMDIPSEDIDLFEPGKPLHVYVIALCIDPIYKATTKEGYGAKLINGLFDFILNLAEQNIEIETITARNQPNKPDGKRLLQKLGMPQLRSPSPHMHLFSMRIADSGYPLFIQYYDTLINNRKKQK